MFFEVGYGVWRCALEKPMIAVPRWFGVHSSFLYESQAGDGLDTSRSLMNIP